MDMLTIPIIFQMLNRLLNHIIAFKFHISERKK